MRPSLRKTLLGGLVGALIVAVAIIAIASGALNASAKSQGDGPSAPHTKKIVATYLSILNEGMASPSCDFSKMSTVYAADATVTLSGGPFSPGGPFGPGNAFGAQQYHGISAIIGFYAKTCHILYGKNAGAPSWTQDEGYVLAPTVLNSYEHIALGDHLTGRCMHVFTVSGDRITSLDWSVYA